MKTELEAKKEYACSFSKIESLSLCLKQSTFFSFSSSYREGGLTYYRLYLD